MTVIGLAGEGTAGITAGAGTSASLVAKLEAREETRRRLGLVGVGGLGLVGVGVLGVGTDEIYERNLGAARTKLSLRANKRQCDCLFSMNLPRQ